MFGESYKLTKQVMANNEAMRRYKSLQKELGISFEEMIKTLYNSNMELIELIKQCDYDEEMKK
jgi:predicted transcriptional regulator